MITILKLTNGIEVVGELQRESSHDVELKNPLQINYRYFVGHIPTVSFVRYIMFAGSSTVVFDKMHVMNCVPARESFSKFYYSAVEQFSTDVEKMIDKELNSTPADEISGEQLGDLLETMSVEGMTVN